MKDMIKVGGKLRPCTYEKARALADVKQKAIDKAREAVSKAESELKKVCAAQYAVGEQVNVHLRPRVEMTHEVIEVSENGWLTLKNTHTGTIRGIAADSYSISPSRCWYGREVTTKGNKNGDEKN